MCIGYLGFGGFLGFLLQVFLVVIIGRFLWRMFMRNRQPALAGGPGMFSRDGAPGMMGGMMGGGSAHRLPEAGDDFRFRGHRLLTPYARAINGHADRGVKVRARRAAA